MEAGEKERGGTLAMLGGYGFELALRPVVSVLWPGVGGVSTSLAVPSLRSRPEETADVISTR